MTGFDKCVKEGGFIRTIQKKGGKYQRTCEIKGKLYKSLIKKKKKHV